MTVSFLSRLSEEDRRRVRSACQRRRYARGDTIVWEQDPGDSVHLIERGRVVVSITTPTGDRAILNVLGSGDHFGELALVDDNARRSASIQALEATETLVLHRREFDQLRTAHPKVEALLVELLAVQVRRLSERVVEALYVPADRRVVRRLKALLDSTGSEGQPQVVHLNQDDLASLAGTSRPTANRVLQGLARQGIVTLRRGAIEVHDPSALSDRD